jgi:hypothetical protein
MRGHDKNDSPGDLTESQKINPSRRRPKLDRLRAGRSTELRSSETSSPEGSPRNSTDTFGQRKRPRSSLSSESGSETSSPKGSPRSSSFDSFHHPERVGKRIAPELSVATRNDPDAPEISAAALS